jgi:CheY-like chemotaxis protein
LEKIPLWRRSFFLTPGAGRGILPCLRVERRQGEPTLTRGGRGGARLAGADGERVALVVDDEDQVRAMVVEMLSGVGFRCLEAGDGETALALLGELRDSERLPHLGVLDIALPGMSGAELAWKIRTACPGFPLVALSGRLGDWDADDLRDLGFSRVFSKPMDCDAFVGYCRGVLDEGPGQ